MQGRGRVSSSLLGFNGMHKTRGEAIATPPRCSVRGVVLAAGALGFLIAVAACGQDRPGSRQEGGPMQEKTIKQVLLEHTDSLMALPGVVGTAQGECAGEPCIRVLVVKKTSDLLEKIPSEIEGYAVEVDETGEIKALDTE